MRKFDTNILMIVLLTLIGVLFLVYHILAISLSSTGVLVSMVMLFSIIVVLHGWKTLGVRELIVFFVFAFCIPLLYEYTDGLGFGGLVNCTPTYSTLLGTKFLGKVPFLIPLVWSIFLYCTFTMTNIIFDKVRTTQTSEEATSQRWLSSSIGRGIIAGLITASLDLIIDPVMVSMGAWSWSSGGPYYGIPLWNYEGWIEIGAVTYVFYSIYLHKIKKHQRYIGGEKRSRYTLFVVVLYLAFLMVFGLYAIEEQVTYAIPWAVMTTGVFSSLVVIQFYRLCPQDGKEVISSVK